MKPLHKNYTLLINRIPLIGICCFGLLYFYSSTLYPGGSQVDLTSEGFDWINNYWCNLMNEKGMNGEANPARPFAILAMTVLCSSLAIFFYQFADFFAKAPIWKRMIKLGGLLSMIFAALLFTKYHNLMTIISSFFGLFAMLGIIKEMYKSDLLYYKIGGILCLLLLGLNNYIYYSTRWLEWLPLLQKITFLIVLIWILGLNFELRKKVLNQCKLPHVQ